jgi:hypothetical protein
VPTQVETAGAAGVHAALAKPVIKPSIAFLLPSVRMQL